MSPIASIQPWLRPSGERIRGTELTRDLAAILSLEDETMPARRALIAMAYHLRNTTLVGNPAPIVLAYEQRLSRPRAGDLIVEVTSGIHSAARGRGDWHRAVGVHLLTRDEWSETDEEWSAQAAVEGWEDDERTTEGDVTYVQYGPNPSDVCRWVNCQFWVLPWMTDFPLDDAAERERPRART